MIVITAIYYFRLKGHFQTNEVVQVGILIQPEVVAQIVVIFSVVRLHLA